MVCKVLGGCRSTLYRDCARRASLLCALYFLRRNGGLIDILKSLQGAGVGHCGLVKYRCEYHMTYFEVVMVEPSLADYRAANGVVLTGATIPPLSIRLVGASVFIILQVGTEPADGSQN